MNIRRKLGLLVLSAVMCVGIAEAGTDTDTVRLFREAGQSGAYFSHSYGYAVFPTIGKAGLGIGGALGTGNVYEHGRLIGNATMTQLSVGFQAGGEAYSEIIFFEDKRSLEEFTKGNFEFSADVGAIAITAAASASAGTEGAQAGASAGKHDAATAGSYQHGVAVFTIAKGGLMYQAAVAGQKFSYEAASSK